MRIIGIDWSTKAIHAAMIDVARSVEAESNPDDEYGNFLIVPLPEQP